MGAAAVEFTSKSELEERISRRRVLELYDDDGDGAILTGGAEPGDLEAFNASLARVNDEVFSLIFRKGFDATQIAALAADKALRGWATDLLAQQAGERRTEFLDSEGHGCFHAIGERARSALRAMSSGELRLRLEDEPANSNPNAVARTGTVYGECPLVMIKPGRSGPGPGGF
jgi:hypothetical protein